MGLPALTQEERLTLEPSPKWVRAVRGGKTVVDSRRAQLVRGSWGPPRTYAFPREDVDGVDEDQLIEVDGHVAVQWGAPERWYEESEEVFIHPRDPHKRIDVLATSRHVVVRRDGETLADTRRAMLLIESFPHLPLRYYILHDDVQAELRPSDTTTGCPYKGWAEYFDVRVGDEWEKDLVWTYRAPLREVEPIRGLLCFFNERVDLEVDGEPVERPQTPWSR